MDVPRKTDKNYFKFMAGIFLCLVVRLIPLRAPNIEPILATAMPFSKHYGAFAGFSFAVLSILLYDILTATLGIHTFFTVGAYGAIGLYSAVYFKKRTASAWNFVRFAVVSTIFFDAVTGLTLGPIFFEQSFLVALVGQIPFTLLHLIGNVAFAAVLSPAIYKFLVRKRKRESETSINLLNPKLI